MKIKEIMPDILCTRIYVSDFDIYFALYFAKKHNIPSMVFHYAGDSFIYLHDFTAIKLYKKIFDLVNQIGVMTDKGVDAIKKVIGHNNVKIFNFGAMVNVETFKPKSSSIAFCDMLSGKDGKALQFIATELKKRPLAKIILFPNRITKIKGVFDVIKVAHLLKEKDSNNEYVFILSGKLIMEEYEEFAAMIKKYNLDNDFFIIKGGISQKSLVNLYAISNAVILPTSQEAFGLVLVEAQLMGIPIVTYTVGGTVESFGPYSGISIKVLDQNNMFCNEENRIKMFANALQEIVSDKWLSQKQRKKRREFILNKIDPIKIIPRFENALKFS